MKKQILIDGSTLTNYTDGLSVYIINVIKHLPDLSFIDFEFTILINKRIKRDDLKPILSDARFKILEWKIASIGPRRDWDMFWFLKKT